MMKEAGKVLMENEDGLESHYTRFLDKNGHPMGYLEVVWKEEEGPPEELESPFNGKRVVFLERSGGIWVYGPKKLKKKCEKERLRKGGGYLE
jgi:hypothetical protein